MHVYRSVRVCSKGPNHQVVCELASSGERQPRTFVHNGTIRTSLVEKNFLLSPAVRLKADPGVRHGLMSRGVHLLSQPVIEHRALEAPLRSYFKCGQLFLVDQSIDRVLVNAEIGRNLFCCQELSSRHGCIA